MHDQNLDRYARVLVDHGAGLRAGQELFIHAEVAHRELALRVAEAAYERGVAGVSFYFRDPLIEAQTIRRARAERIELAHEDERHWFAQVLRSHGALISLRGQEYPELMPSLAESHPAQHETYSRSSRAVGRAFHTHGINRSLCPWVVAGAATRGWASRVRPALSEDPVQAEQKLWDLLFSFTYADREDSVHLAAEKDRRLHARRRLLNELAIEEVHIHGGGSDLRVGFSERARWLGGSKQTGSGQVYNANVPSEENYTTPHRDRTEGTLRATMPFRTKSGVLVEDLELRFEQGRVVDFHASCGVEGLRRWIDSDHGARFLGEFALVGQDSPIAQSGLFFEHTLYDENAWSHVALGKAYATALEGSSSLTHEQLQDLGCNDSEIHTDIMFGSLEVSVTATRSRQGEVTLIEKGQWAEPFLDPAPAS